MKKVILFLGILLSFSSVAQVEKHFGCATDEHHFNSIKNDKEYEKRFNAINESWQRYALKKQSDKYVEKSQTNPITLSVVFHDLSNSGSFLPLASNLITEYQYIIDKLNLIYDGTNLNGTPGNNSYINFCLAQKNIHGDTYTVPLSRVNNVAVSANLDNSDQTQINQIVTAANTSVNFPTKKYINVYIVDNISGSTAGFATLPSAHGATIDGIYIERQYLINDANINTNMNVLAHEMGHYLGLFHTFGICKNSFEECSCDNDNCLFNGDMICDTPPNQKQFSGYTATSFPNTCTDIPYPSITDGTHPLVETVDPKDNYMDYGVWAWQYKFSPGQIERMNFMVDPDYGPRKSLLGQSECVDCIALNGCEFSIIPNVTLPNPRHEIIQTSTGTPSIVFNPNMNCSPPSTNAVNYYWTLELLGSPNQIIFQNVLVANYTTPASLAPGNYQLTLTATLQSNVNCIETATYNFSIYPMAGNCNLNLPSSNSTSDWISNNWERTSSENGWVIVGGNYPVGSSQYSDGDVAFDNSAYDIIPLSAGGTLSDPNFNTITLPSTANITKVMRVGKTTDGGGKAFYTKITIPVTSDNCKFRIWYLGQTDGVRSNIAYPFINNNTNNDAAFGWVCQYQYNSPVNTITSTFNSEIGLNETNLLYGKNDLISLSVNSSLSDFSTIGGFKRMTQWKYKDLDFSEFVNLTPDTEITLTFFAHSNIAANALQEAYSYYGIECLGGGVPSDFSLNIEDISIPCNSPGIQSCTKIVVPTPRYVNLDPTLTSYSFTNIKIYRKLASGLYDINPYPMQNPQVFNSTNYTYSFYMCFNQSDAPYQDFKIVYKTLHGTYEDTFRVHIGFYNNLTDCTEGDQIDGDFHPGIINGEILICGLNNLPSLHLTETCISEPHTYQWYYGSPPNGTKIPGETGEFLQLANNPLATSNTFSSDHNFFTNQCNIYHRKVFYKEPYCENLKQKISERFIVYNNSFNFSGFSTDNDICLGDIYQMEVVNPKIESGCRIPLHLYNSNDQNNLTFQMYDPVSGQHIGSINTFTFNGQINATSNLPLPILPNPLVFTFDNINPSSPGNYLFVPTSTQTSFPINLHITGTYLACPVDMMLSNYQYINFQQSANGGSIDLNCNSNAIDNIDSGLSNGNIYNWEYSTDGFNFLPITGAPNTNNLPASIVNSLTSSNPTLYIRRVSLGFVNCPSVSYSNTVFITNHPPTIEFNLPSTICEGEVAPVLPTVSDNGIIGSWNVLTASNTTSATYTFTPLSGYCLPNYIYSLTISSANAPVFNQLAPICQGESFILPTTSINGISGSWSPAINSQQTTTYTFSPNIRICSNDIITMTVEVHPSVIPSFDLPSSICIESVPPTLPTTSLNGILGTWSPSVISNTAPGSYVFTPNLGQCAVPKTININVLTECELFLEWGSDVSCQLTDDTPGIKFDDEIVDGPCIRVCENSIIQYTINGNISNIDYTEWNVIGGTILTSSDISCEIQWGTASYSAIQTIVHYNDGTIKQINRCVEKLNGPNALFEVLPNGSSPEVIVCVDNTIIFDNLTTTNNGHDNIYYNWNFGDGTTSNEFEPTHIYTNAGTYEVTLVAYNGCSCIGSYTIKIHVIKGMPQIQCPSVVCEGDRTTYSLPKEIGEKCKIEWVVDGGDIVFQNSNNTEIDVIWNNVNESGFGTVTASAPECFKCSSTIKVPVIQNKGTIIGTDVLCEKAQGLYALPQWPTTEFNWTLDDAGTGAILIANNQRNEIVVRAGYTGSITLYCTYFNTLLGCGGKAEYTIFVKPTAFLEGNETVCINSIETYEFVSNGNSTSTINWVVTGSNGFSQSGSGSPFTFTFTNAGVYHIAVDDENYCGSFKNTIVVEDLPAAPTAISGPTYICPGIPIIYSCAVPDDTIVHWELQNGDIIGSSTGSQITANFNPTATTPYLIKVWYEKNGCISQEFIKTITREIPVITFDQADSSVCGSSYSDYSIIPLNVDNYIWSISPATAGSIQSGQNSNSVSILWNQDPVTAIVKVEVRKCGATYFETYTVDVMSHGDATATIPTNACLSTPYSVDFNVLGTGTFTSATWDFGDGTPPVTVYAPTTSATHIYEEPITTSTTFNVTVTVFNAGGCPMPVEITQPVTVSPTPIIELSPKRNLNYCDPANIAQDFTYTVNIQNGFSSTYSIEWFKNGVSIATTASITVTDPGTATDEYYAVVTNTYGCSATTQIFNVYNNCNINCNLNLPLNAISEVIDCQTVKVTPTIIGGSPTSVYWSNTNLPGATILQNDINGFSAENITPGEYSITLNAAYNVNGTTCYNHQNIPVIVPYKAGLKYSIACTGSNLYTVTLLDHSVYYAETPIDYFAFTYDGGANWYPATVVGGIPQLTIALPPGNYNVGVKIWNSSYPVCEKMEPLNLPAYPVATFTNEPSICQRDALQFIADDDTPGLQYHWTFYDGGPSNQSTNLQQKPVKAFSSTTFNFVSLTVTNRLGCTATHTARVTVLENNMAGILNVIPATVCEGGSVEINYQANGGTDPVETLYWYHNEYTATPFAVTHAPNLSLTVNQPGQYFAYGENQYGCMEYGKIDVASVVFVPGPEAPMITGPVLSCVSSGIHLEVPENTNLRYFWSLNGMPQTYWNNQYAIDFFPTASGTYLFEVTPQIQAANGQWCNGTTASHTVTVVAEPVAPQLQLQVLSCYPYKVEVSVQNPQAGANYYWSNGDTGTTATITHDGPLQVRVEINGCSATEQLNLPVDLESLAWIFPKGCMATCFEKGDGYIIGPLGEFEKWKWLENGNGVQGGSGSVDAFYDIAPTNSYALYLETEYCAATWEALDITYQKCPSCKLKYAIKKIKCVKVNGVYLYEVVFSFNNTSGVPLTINLNVPGGQGYFITSSFTLPIGNSIQTLYFYPLNGFSGGTFQFFLEGNSVKGNCLLKAEINLPNCKDKIKELDETPAENVIVLAPNPAITSTTIHYQLVNNGAVTVELYDATGRAVWQTIEKENKGSLIIDCEKYAAGYYLIFVKQNGTTVHQSKLIIQ